MRENQKKKKRRRKKIQKIATAFSKDELQIKQRPYALKGRNVSSNLSLSARGGQNLQ